VPVETPRITSYVVGACRGMARIYRGKSKNARQDRRAKRIRSPALYPAELQAHTFESITYSVCLECAALDCHDCSRVNRTLGPQRPAN